MSKGTSAAGFIRDDASRVLLVRHSYGPLNWELPGGAGNPGESSAETAIREVREETGLDVRVDYLAGVYYDREYDFHHFLLACTRIDATAPPVAPASEEISDCAWWSVEDLPRPISDFTLRRIADGVAAPKRVPVVQIGRREYLY